MDLKSRPITLLRITAIIFAIIDISVTYHSYFDYSSKEQWFLGIIILAFLVSIISFVLLTLILPNVLSHDVLIKIDVVAHAVIAILVFIGTLVMTIEVHNVRPTEYALPLWVQDNERYTERIVACIFGFLSSITYGTIALRIARVRVA